MPQDIQLTLPYEELSDVRPAPVAPAPIVPAPVAPAPVSPSEPTTVVPPHQQLRELAQRVRKSFVCVEFTIHRGPRTRSVSADLKQHVAEVLDATEDSFSLPSRLFSGHEPTVKAINVALNRFKLLFDNPYYTLPYPAPRRRLLDERRLKEFEQELQRHYEALRQAVVDFAEQLPAIKERQRERRGLAFREEDYAFDPHRAVCVEHRYLNLEPPSYLLRLDPKVYEQQAALLEADFQKAVALREQELAQQLLNSVQHLLERLQTGEDGRPRTFRDSTVERLREAIQDVEQEAQRTGIGQGPLLEAVRRFGQLHVLHDASAAADSLRTNEKFREQVQSSLNRLQETLLELSIVQPRRKIDADFGG